MPLGKWVEYPAQHLRYLQSTQKPESAALEFLASSRRPQGQVKDTERAQQNLQFYPRNQAHAVLYSESCGYQPFPAPRRNSWSPAVQEASRWAKTGPGECEQAYTRMPVHPHGPTVPAYSFLDTSGQTPYPRLSDLVSHHSSLWATDGPIGPEQGPHLLFPKDHEYLWEVHACVCHPWGGRGFA